MNIETLIHIQRIFFFHLKLHFILSLKKSKDILTHFLYILKTKLETAADNLTCTKNK